MPGYNILEERHLSTYKEDGIPPNEIKIGLLDFLRELRGGAQGIPKLSSFMVVGIEEVLFLAGEEGREKISLFIRKTLQSAATVLDQKKCDVQIVTKGKLFKADSFWVEYRSERIRLDNIFGTTIRREIRTLPVYFAGFNLSS
jgi:hypothetical protein